MIILQEAKAEEEYILHNLMQFYIYEFSKYIPSIQLEDDGSYQWFNLDKYWQNDHFHAYFIKHYEELIGFALLESQSENQPNTIEEFFIVGKYHGQGFGKIAATQLFNKYPGAWSVHQMEKNKPSQAFWKKVISRLTEGYFVETVEQGKHIQEFHTNSFKKAK
ncbi:acetyltransferase [Halobacillus andaensis]|uniref:Acetyltransferase n=1 Tax=Halobacillus andaensis TaxID=1176239 RepID=A0A917EVT2_HALAA|nr:GNAT family N-acetyltransferase [Halobacillus andaensis]MBP2003837.1 putative acetyltransferase [Halobacillus andaensis]GGF13632.1 acetyltransferase [Halobacillus andaensis]